MHLHVVNELFRGTLSSPLRHPTSAQISGIAALDSLQTGIANVPPLI
jgi:hypothetical protein